MRTGSLISSAERMFFVLRTLGVGLVEVQLLDLSGPRHGRQHLEGVLAVDLLAVVNVELQESAKRLEILELACRMGANQK